MSMTMAPRDVHISPQRAAKMLGVSRFTIVRMIDTGAITGHQLRRHGRWRIEFNSVVRLRQHFADGGSLEEYLDRLRGDVVSQ